MQTQENRIRDLQEKFEVHSRFAERALKGLTNRLVRRGNSSTWPVKSIEKFDELEARYLTDEGKRIELVCFIIIFNELSKETLIH